MDKIKVCVHIDVVINDEFLRKEMMLQSHDLLIFLKG